MTSCPLARCLEVLVSLLVLAAGDNLVGCFGRCRVEQRPNREVVIFAENFLTIRRHFSASALRLSEDKVITLKIECTKALLGETIPVFGQHQWGYFLQHVLHISVHRCRVVKISTAAFSNFRVLTSIVILNDDGDSVIASSERSFSAAWSLASVTIAGALIEKLPPLMFKGIAKSLQMLSLSSNGIKNIEKDSFCAIDNLSDLDLSNNELDGGNLSFLNCMHTLYYLNMSSNKVVTFSGEHFIKNKLLHTLDVSSNLISNFSSILNVIISTSSINCLHIIGNPFQCDYYVCWRLHGETQKRNLKITDWTTTKCLTENYKTILVSDLVNATIGWKAIVSFGIVSLLIAFCITIAAYMTYTKRASGSYKLPFQGLGSNFVRGIRHKLPSTDVLEEDSANKEEKTTNTYISFANSDPTSCLKTKEEATIFSISPQEQRTKPTRPRSLSIIQEEKGSSAVFCTSAGTTTTPTETRTITMANTESARLVTVSSLANFHAVQVNKERPTTSSAFLAQDGHLKDATNYFTEPKFPLGPLQGSRGIKTREEDHQMTPNLSQATQLPHGDPSRPQGRQEQMSSESRRIRNRSSGNECDICLARESSSHDADPESHAAEILSIMQIHGDGPCSPS